MECRITFHLGLGPLSARMRRIPSQNAQFLKSRFTLTNLKNSGQSTSMNASNRRIRYSVFFSVTKTKTSTCQISITRGSPKHFVLIKIHGYSPRMAPRISLLYSSGTRAVYAHACMLLRSERVLQHALAIMRVDGHRPAEGPSQPCISYSPEFIN